VIKITFISFRNRNIEGFFFPGRMKELKVIYPGSIYQMVLPSKTKFRELGEVPVTVWPHQSRIF
jgi:hypothetical protein